MQTLRKKPMLRKIVATCLLVCGLLFVALPILPGWVLIGLSLFLFSIDSPRIQNYVHTYRNKHRYLDRALSHTYDRLHAKYSAIEHTLEKKIEEAI
ncbi:hypothetical protein K2X96_01125 [Patescibacteria group bacterium]|nr:hypothetical protein [Patescibacteria group bacterium]